MEIVIYWDSLFLLNFIMNYWILRVLIYKFRLSVKGLRAVLAALFGAGIYILCLFLPIGTRYVQFLEMGLSIFMMSIFLLPKKSRRMFFKVSLYGLFCSFFVAGILRTIFSKGKLFSKGQIHILSVLTFGYVVIEGILVNVSRQKQNQKQRLCKVRLKSEKDTVFVTALVDTGNSLIEPISQKPVCLLEHPILEKLIEMESTLFRVIPYRSVGCEQGILYGFEIPEIQITYRMQEILLKQVFCAEVHHKLSTNDTYNMILHPACIEEICEES